MPPWPTPRQRPEPDRHRQPAAAARHHDRGQVLSRRAPGAGRSRHRRASRRRDRPARLQGRHELAARIGGYARLRRGPRRDPRRRGEAPASRIPTEGRALQLARGRPAAGHRQVRREGRVGAAAGRLAAARRLRADARDDRPRHRRPHRPLLHQRHHPRAPGHSWSRRKGAGPAEAVACSGCRTIARAARTTPRRRVPEGSRALAGIGCHYMATWIYGDSTQTFSQMGGEGVAWIGQAPFTDAPHVFANLGDGTYFHSGILAIRAAVAAKVNITYKILYNDAVAMTGGQPVDGPLSVTQLVAQLEAEGLERIVVVADERERDAIGRLPSGVPLHPRDELEAGPARAARDRGRHGAGLRADLCRREAPPPQARQISRPGATRLHQRACLRRLRRLLEQVELRLRRAGRDRVRPQARDRPVVLQQGLFLPRRLLPELRHRRGRQAAQGQGGGQGGHGTGPHCPSRHCRRSSGPGES